MKSKEYYQDNRARRKQICLDVMGGKCQICGYNANAKALEFHHIHPKEKTFTISECTLKGLDILFKELRKCTLLCANCHRIIHDGELDESLKSSFDENKAQEYFQQEEYLKLFNAIQKEPKYCPICNKLIHSYRNKYCSLECSHKGYSRQQGNGKERPDREQLKQLIRNQSFTFIGKIYGVNDNAIRKWCDKYNLPRTKIQINQYTDEQWKEI